MATLEDTHYINNNIAVCKEYMNKAYNPKTCSGAAVNHLVAPQSFFIAPTTFPIVHDCIQYAESHKGWFFFTLHFDDVTEIMQSLTDLHIISFDIICASGRHVCMRYTAEGTHIGAPHNGILPTGRHAKWTAAMFFELTDGKIVSCIKEWDKLSMWKQLGWNIEEASCISEGQ